ncbi:MAG: hypothetical protein ACRD0Y_04915 [Terriglobales bacterium]
MIKRNPIIWFCAILALAAVAQVPGSIRLATTYTPNSWLLYSISVHSTLVTATTQHAAMHATLDTEAEAQLHILPGATTNNFEVSARFTRYKTTAATDNPAQKAELEQQASATDRAATSMKPAVFRVANGTLRITFRQPGDNYDQPVDMLSEIVRNDDLPSGAVTVGAQWTRTRTRSIPKTTIAMPLTLHCRLSALGSEAGEKTAVIVINSAASANLPPGSLPGSQQLAREGLVPLGKFSFNTVATSTYRAADGVLLGTKSQTHSNMNLQFIGPSPQAVTSDTEIHSTGSVRLEKILRAPGKDQEPGSGNRILYY